MVYMYHYENYRYIFTLLGADRDDRLCSIAV